MKIQFLAIALILAISVSLLMSYVIYKDKIKEYDDSVYKHVQTMRDIDSQKSTNLDLDCLNMWETTFDHRDNQYRSTPEAAMAAKMVFNSISIKNKNYQDVFDALHIPLRIREGLATQLKRESIISLRFDDGTNGIIINIFFNNMGDCLGFKREILY